MSTPLQRLGIRHACFYRPIGTQCMMQPSQCEEFPRTYLRFFSEPRSIYFCHSILLCNEPTTNWAWLFTLISSIQNYLREGAINDFRQDVIKALRVIIVDLLLSICYYYILMVTAQARMLFIYDRNNHRIFTKNHKLQHKLLKYL